MKNGDHKTEITVFALFAVMAAGELIWGLRSDSLEMLGTQLLVFGISVPVFAFAGCLLLGMKKGAAKWIALPVFTAYSCLLPCIVYGEAKLADVFVGLLPSVFGVLIGMILKSVKDTKKGQ